MKKTLLALVVLLSFASVASAQVNCSTLGFQNETIPEFTLGQPANFQMTAVGGTAPYTFTIIDGALPPNLHMNKNGKISGVPKAVADVTVTIQLRDANGCVVNQAFPVRVNP